MIGRTLAHYEIVEKIGSGGMGDVYLAADRKLDREIALKVLPPELSGNAERRARFEREAKAVAALNHPNIVTVYSVEEAEGVHFITMELVKGKTLAEIQPSRGFSVGKFLDIAIPLADAVCTAHQHGITHRDLKPDNVMVNEEGRVKVLDFGLAKPRRELGANADPSDLSTQQKMTQEWAILGTLAYMSPEQAEGRPVDERSDIFSLGVLFYEMLTGKRPFQGDSAAATQSAILRDTPRPLADVRPDIPRDLARLVRRCLAKDVERRYQSSKDVRNELEELKESLTSGELEPAFSRRMPKPWAWAAAVGIAATAGYLARSTNAPESDNVVPRFVNPAQLTSAVGVEDYPTWSPDGRTIAYQSNQSGNWDIWIVQVGGGEPVNRTSDHEGDDARPSFSPDGTQITFYSSREGGGIFVMSPLGGSASKLASAPIPHRAAVWSPDGSELAFVVRDAPDRTAVQILSMATRESRNIPLDDVGPFDASWSNDERFLAYVNASTYDNDATTLRLLQFSNGRVHDLDKGGSAHWSPAWSADGGTLFYVSNRGGSRDLWQLSMAEDGRPTGEPRRLTTGIGMRRMALSRDQSKIAYSQGGRIANVWRVPILPHRRADWDDAEQITFDQAFVETLDLSRDGKRLYISSDRAGHPSLWVVPVDGGEMERLTAVPAPDWAPRLSPDGETIVFHSYRSGNREIWVMPATGGPARQLTRDERSSILPEWSPDARAIVFSSTRSGNHDLWIVPAEGGEPRQITTHPAMDASWAKMFSPDGKWLTFNSDRSGRWGVWRIAIEGDGGEAQLVKDDAFLLAWSRDRQTLYVHRDDHLIEMSADGAREHVVADLSGRRGSVFLSYGAIDDNGEWIYFLWRDDLGDLWVMDVETNTSGSGS